MIKTPQYFWGDSEFNTQRQDLLPTHLGYNEARRLIDGGRIETLSRHCGESIEFVAKVFEAAVTDPDNPDSPVVRLHLSGELQRWRDQQHKLGRILPPKGKGLGRCSDEVLHIFRASTWPDALVTSNALFGGGFANFLVGAHDARTLFSNYLTDMAFYYEHGYHYVFPALETLIEQAQNDRYVSGTLGASQRREAVSIGIQYIKAKIAMEEKCKRSLSGLSAKMPSRLLAQKVYLLECEILGISQEAIEQGYDPAGAMHDMVFSPPSSDVVDVGSDIHNSEVMNSILNTSDITDTGEVSEHSLCKIYDAVSHCSARMLTERWSEPTTQVGAALYTWHLLNDRHYFLTRAVLGYCKTRATAREQREADFDEAFDERYHTTGFSRPLEGACHGGDMCNLVTLHLDRGVSDGMLAELWNALVMEPVEYVKAGVMDDCRERYLEEQIRLWLARTYVQGYVPQLRWTLAHAGHHAWQVNRLFEAAMFGSILDDGALAGKLDRAEPDSEGSGD